MCRQMYRSDLVVVKCKCCQMQIGGAVTPKEYKDKIMGGEEPKPPEE